jgi:hypothetical protein
MRSWRFEAFEIRVRHAQRLEDSAANLAFRGVLRDLLDDEAQQREVGVGVSLLARSGAGGLGTPNIIQPFCLSPYLLRYQFLPPSVDDPDRIVLPAVYARRMAWQRCNPGFGRVLNAAHDRGGSGYFQRCPAV